MDQQRKAGDRHWWQTGFLLAILLLGMGLGLYQLAEEGLWLDEISTALYAQEPTISDVLHWLDAKDGRPLHFILAHLVTLLVEGEFFLRLPSVAAAILGLVATYKVGQVVLGRSQGLIAAFLLALSPLYVQYSQEARPYALFACLSLFSLFFLFQAWTSAQRRWWMGFTIVSVLNLYTHYFASIVLAAELGVSGVLFSADWIATWKAKDQKCVRQGRERQRLVVLAVVSVAIGLAMLPSLSHIEGFLTREAGGPTLATNIELSWPFVVDVLNKLSSGVAENVYAPANMQIWTGFFLLGLLTWGLQRRYRSLLMVVVWLVLPFAVLSLVPTYHFFNIRHAIFVLPGFLLVVAMGIAGVSSALQRLANRWFSSRWGDLVQPAVLTVTLIAIGALSVAPLRLYYEQNKTPWREVGAFLDSHVQPGDVVLVEPWYQRRSLSYYSDLASIKDGIAFEQVPDMVDAGSAVWYITTRKNNPMEEWLPEQVAVDLIFAGYDPSGKVQDINVWLYRKAWQEERDAAPREGVALAADAALLYPKVFRKDLTLAQIYMCFDDPDQAVAYYEQALDKVPSLLQGQIYKELGRLFTQQGKTEAALEAYQRATELLPDQAWLYVLQGDALLSMQEPDRALDMFRQAATLNLGFEQQVWYHMRLGNSYRQAGETDQAIAAYERVLALEPDNARAQKWLTELRTGGE